MKENSGQVKLYNSFTITPNIVQL